LGKNPWRNEQKHALNNMHMMPSPRFDSVPNWWEVRVHTTAAILLPKSISLPKQFSQLNYNHFELIWQTRLPFWRLFKFESTSISTWILL